MLTDRTQRAIRDARSIVAKPSPADYLVVPYAEAIVEIMRPNRIDAARVDRGDWHHASALSRCTCGAEYADHAHVHGFEWLRRLCDGRFVKL